MSVEERLKKLIEEFEKQKKSGSLTIHFKDGKIMQFDKKEIEKVA